MRLFSKPMIDLPQLTRERAQSIVDAYARIEALEQAVRTLQAPLSRDLVSNYRTLIEGGRIPATILEDLLTDAIVRTVAAHLTEITQIKTELTHLVSEHGSGNP